MDKSNYKPRIIDDEVEEHLSAFGAVCIEGPKWCGKTWTSAFHSNSEIYLGDPKGNFQNRRMAVMDPALILEGASPRLIDEWQEVPSLWDAVRYKVDERGEKGIFILTGSATPNHKGILHSGAGRIARLRMRPMSLYESGDSDGKISLKELCEGQIKAAFIGEVELQRLIKLIVRGGWPANIGLSMQRAAMLPKQYIETIINKDDVFGIVSLVGPSFAEEVASKSLTAVVASSENEEAAKIVQQAFSNDWIRVYTNTDVIGASICSSLKNVIALASGILSGLDMKANPQAALITRGMAEITRFVIAMGGKPETCLGLTGIGDLVLTCTSKTSRNFQAGYMIAKYGLDYFKKNYEKTVEGIFACEIAKEIAEEKGIYAPIVCSVYNSVFLGKSPKEEVYRLMKNALKSE